MASILPKVPVTASLIHFSDLVAVLTAADPLSCRCHCGFMFGVLVLDLVVRGAGSGVCAGVIGCGAEGINVALQGVDYWWA